ncbi:hypothetical protein M1P56_35200 (plasmid) [Streptomyces sp. HU2014]|uniref:hypothetical protein n=1 Tax=Streptomyces sp. HU2014 TaxID=2939414 RepID=UPI00200E7AB1|nr:hypothetical protein [Streptomyces sp. HU2014]UQI49761.1 hypothetical protein M1P56_35200 [Streptomyces sp. HU2014]
MRRIAEVMACEYSVELPAKLIVLLAITPQARPPYLATALPGLPEETRLALTEDPDPRVRAATIDS